MSRPEIGTRLDYPQPTMWMTAHMLPSKSPKTPPRVLLLVLALLQVERGEVVVDRGVVVG